MHLQCVGFLSSLSLQRQNSLFIVEFLNDERGLATTWPAAHTVPPTIAGAFFSEIVHAPATSVLPSSFVGSGSPYAEEMA